jgi:hypothetical protein
MMVDHHLVAAVAVDRLLQAEHQRPTPVVCAEVGGVRSSLPRQNGQLSTCVRVSRSAGCSASRGRIARAVATSTASAGTTGLMRISRIGFASLLMVGSLRDQAA